MGNAQNIRMQSSTKSPKRHYQVQGARLDWGKFYESNKNDEVSPDKINLKTFQLSSNTMVNSCGRNDTSSGTEGTIEIWNDGVKAGEIYWSCPWLTGTANTVQAREVNPEYWIMIGDYPRTGFRDRFRDCQRQQGRLMPLAGF